MIKIPDMPAREHPLLSRFGMVSDEYKVAAAEARYYRENKKAVFSRMVMEVMKLEGEQPTNKAELKVRASAPWQAYLDKLIETANKASDLKIQLDNLKNEAEFEKRRDIQAALERKYG